MKVPTIQHPELINSLRLAYSAERAASYAYIGHAASLRDPAARIRVTEIEQDELGHRREVGVLMERYAIPVSHWLEFKYAVIGRVIGLSCHVIGRFMPYFFAGKLESGNVCEYIVMIRHFHELGINEHDEVLYAMGLKEKEHEVFFQAMIEGERWLPLFEKVFAWGVEATLNDVDIQNPLPVDQAGDYCKNYTSGGRGERPERHGSLVYRGRPVV
ncbi:MAG: ferritin-like domain-containing protein [Lentimonas sp.]